MTAIMQPGLHQGVRERLAGRPKPMGMFERMNAEVYEPSLFVTEERADYGNISTWYLEIVVGAGRETLKGASRAALRCIVGITNVAEAIVPTIRGLAEESEFTDAEVAAEVKERAPVVPTEPDALFDGSQSWQEREL